MVGSEAIEDDSEELISSLAAAIHHKGRTQRCLSTSTKPSVPVKLPSYLTPTDHHNATFQHG